MDSCNQLGLVWISPKNPYGQSYKTSIIIDLYIDYIIGVYNIYIIYIYVIDLYYRLCMLDTCLFKHVLIRVGDSGLSKLEL